MSMFEAILNHMLEDDTFADAVFTNAASAVSEYTPSAEDLARLKAMSRDEFDSLKFERSCDLGANPISYVQPAEVQLSQITKLFSPKELTISDFQTLVNKVMTDEAFVNALASNPEKALKDAGITPTAEMLDALKGVDAAAIKNLAASMGEEKAAIFQMRSINGSKKDAN